MKTSDFIKREWSLWIVILVPLVLVLVKWSAFPDKIPMHWNLEGEVDRYGGKWGLFLSPMINFGVYLLMIFIPRFDPRRRNYDLFGGAYWIMRILIATMLSVFGVVTALASLGVSLNVGLIVESSCIGLFLLLGNLFGKIRPNFFVGLRTPWTISSEEVWMKTHRLAGKLWVIGSVIMLPLLFLLPAKISFIAFIVYISVLVIVPVVYSWKIFRELPKENGTVK